MKGKINYLRLKSTYKKLQINFKFIIHTITI